MVTISLPPVTVQIVRTLADFRLGRFGVSRFTKANTNEAQVSCVTLREWRRPVGIGEVLTVVHTQQLLGTRAEAMRPGTYHYSATRRSARGGVCEPGYRSRSPRASKPFKINESDFGE
jgi:hypothetical protein